MFAHAGAWIYDPGVKPARRRIFFTVYIVVLILLGVFLTEALVRLWTPPPRPEFDRPRYLVGPPRISPLRERPEIPEKPSGVFRIFALGDSFTWGANVQLNYTYPKLLEELLNLSGDTRFEVYNFGVNGANTADEIAMLHRVRAHDPDLVLVGYFLNDPERSAELPSDVERLVEQSASDSLRPSWLQQKSHLVRALGLRLWARKLTSSQIAHFHSLYDPDNETWKRHSAHLAQLARVGERYEIPVKVVAWPHLAFPLDHRYPFREIHEQLVWQLQHERLPALDLLETFWQKDHYRLQAVPVYDPHPSEIAHRMAAEAIFDWLIDSEPLIARHIVNARIRPHDPFQESHLLMALPRDGS